MPSANWTQKGRLRCKPEMTKRNLGQPRILGRASTLVKHSRYKSQYESACEKLESHRVMSHFILGVDVSLEHLDSATATAPAVRKSIGRYANNAAGWQALASAVEQQAAKEGDEACHTIHLIIEPTGGYEEGLLYFAYRHGWLVTLVNPLQVRRFAEGQGQRAKTDRQDALLLAWYGATMQPSPQDELDEGADQLDDLLRRRHDLEQLRQAEANRLAQVKRKPRSAPAVQESLERTLHALEQELQALRHDSQTTGVGR